MNWIRGVIHVTTLDECGRESGGVRVVAGLVDNADASPEVLSALVELLARAAASAGPVVASLRDRNPSNAACRASHPQSQSPDQAQMQ